MPLFLLLTICSSYSVLVEAGPDRGVCWKICLVLDMIAIIDGMDDFWWRIEFLVECRRDVVVPSQP